MLFLGGFVMFEGYESLPGDILLNLEAIRNWANEEGLIIDPDFQLMNTEKMEELKTVFSPEDQMQIAIAIHKEESSLNYLEYPFIPVKSLIKKGATIDLYYWRMLPSAKKVSGPSNFIGDVKFGFIYPGTYQEICSLSAGNLVVQKFTALFNQLYLSCPITTLSNGEISINVEGKVKAQFTKSGRKYDVIFSLTDR
ncbi:MAG: hypothetical protein FVQ83_03545 [Chloroflexi bacterium]|nr:hypothetical protein [Chloroflexota bacterium]